MDSAAVSQLAAIVGKENIATDPLALEFASADALLPFRAHPREGLLDSRAEVVVRPGSTEEVVAVVRLANERRVPVVPYGGGTGVMGGVVPLRGGIAVDLRRMNRLLSVDAGSRLAWVEAGMVLEALDNALASHGMCLGHDPWSKRIATVGGAIGTNSLGYRNGRYGSMGRQVVAVQAVLPTGEVLQTRAIPYPSAGPDLTRLFVGAEGVFGTVTRAAIRVFPLPEERAFQAYGFASFEDGYAMFSAMETLGIHPGVVELSEERETPAGPLETTLYLVFEGFTEEVAALRQRVARLAARCGGKDLGPDPALEYWRDRYAIADRWRDQLRPLPPTQRRANEWPFDYVHVALAGSRVPEYRRRAHALLEGTLVFVRASDCWGAPELFSLLLGVRDGAPDPRAAMAGAEDRLLGLALEMDGGVEYCHGVGVKLLPYIAREWGVGYEVVQAMKRALDPNGIMNPGKLALQ